MFPAATKSGGQCLAFPDVCKTPSPPYYAPIPYPDEQFEKNLKAANEADAKAKAGSKQAQAECEQAIDSLFRMTGMKAASATQAVIIGKAAHLGAMTAHNGANTNMPSGVQLAPSQTKVTLA